MQHMETEQQFDLAIAGDNLTIAVFKADWCGDCRFIEPFMPDLEQKYADKVTFVEVDRDEQPELGERLGILGIPSFIAFSRGQELIRFVSKLRKTREEIEQFTDRAIAVSESLAR
jgi:thiol-disulfide isomerase/thioredoxin